MRNSQRIDDGYLKTIPDKLSGILDNQIKSLLKTPRENAFGFELKALVFYRTCEEGLRNKTRIYEQIIDFVKTISGDNGWPIWRNSWKSDSFNWFNILINLKLYGIEPLIKGRVIPYRYNTTGKTFLIECIKPEIGYNREEDLKDKYYIKRYEDELRNMFLDFGIYRSDASKYAEEVIEFEKGLQRIFSDSIYYNNYYSSNDINSQFNYNEFQEYYYQRFKTEFWKIDWDHYFKSVFGFHKLRDTYVITVSGGRYLKTMIEYIEKTPNSVIANFLFKSIILNENIFELMHPTNKPNFCVHATKVAMNPTVTFMYLHKYFNDKTEVDVFNMVNSIKLAHLQIWNLLVEEDDTIIEIKNKLDKMRLVFLSDHIDFLERSSHSYLGIDIDKINFIKTYFRYIRHNSLRDIPKDYVRQILLTNGMDIEPKYIAEKNALIIPPGIMQLPYYNLTWPKLFKYSKLGLLISRQISNAFNNYGRQLDENGNKREWWITRNNVAMQIEQNLIKKYNGINYDGVQINNRLTLKENWADYLGLLGAFKSYQNKLLERKYYDHMEQIPRTGLSSNQTFFVSYAQNFCEEYLQYESNSIYIPSKLRVNGPTSLMEEFLFSFGCNQFNRH